MIIHPMPAILPASPFHQFMARGNWQIRTEESKVDSLNICLSSKETEPFRRRYFLLAHGTPQEGYKASHQENSIRVLSYVTSRS